MLLFQSKKTVTLFEDSDVLLECLLAGDISETADIQWFFNGQRLHDSDKYTTPPSENVVCFYCLCLQSQLQIKQANSSDIGTYTCSYKNLAKEIAVLSKHLSLCT